MLLLLFTASNDGNVFSPNNTAFQYIIYFIESFMLVFYDL